LRQHQGDGRPHARTRNAELQPVSPRTLSADAKRSRWQSIWFANVTLTTDPLG